MRPPLPLTMASLLLALTGCDRPSADTAQSGGTSAAGAAFSACVACHRIDQSGAHGAGPNLYGIIGRKAGSAAGFNYSRALRESGPIWSPETLDRFLANPSATVPGTRMTVSAPQAETRKAIIEHLARNGGSKSN
jgi:cytochrome c